MRLNATSDSARQGEPSLLAIAETTAAIAATVWIGVYSQTWIHVFASAVIAPFFLLQNDLLAFRTGRWLNAYKGFSTQLIMPHQTNFSKALTHLMKPMDPALRKPRQMLAHASRSTLIMGTLLLQAPFAILVIRVASTMWSAVTSPATCLKAITGNWWRVVVASDSFVSPEWWALPRDRQLLEQIEPVEDRRQLVQLWTSMGAAEAVEQLNQDVRVYEQLATVGGAVALFVRAIRLRYKRIPQAESWTIPQFVVFFLSIPFQALYLMLFCVPGIAYRWAIKSTAIVWFPLLWSLRPVKPLGRDWHTHLRIETDLKRPQLVAVVSAMFLLGLLLKYTLWAGEHALTMHAEAWRDMFAQRNSSLAASPLVEALIAVVRPGAIPMWQIATFANSLLGLFVWWKIRDWLACYRHNAAPSSDTIDRTLGTTFIVRRLFSSYVIACNGYIALQLARNLPVPEIGSALFPWV